MATASAKRLVFIRSLSATPFILRALNPHDRSSSSSLTSTYIPLMTSPQPEKRKVAGSIPALATRIDARCTQAHGPTRIHHGDELRETAEVLCLKLFGAYSAPGGITGAAGDLSGQGRPRDSPSQNKPVLRLPLSRARMRSCR